MIDIQSRLKKLFEEENEKNKARKSKPNMPPLFTKQRVNDYLTEPLK
jgi:hypothetical protein